MVGWSGGWSDDWRVMLNSTQDQIKLKLKFELSFAICYSCCCIVFLFNGYIQKIVRDTVCPEGSVKKCEIITKDLMGQASSFR